MTGDVAMCVVVEMIKDEPMTCKLLTLCVLHLRTIRCRCLLLAKWSLKCDIEVLSAVVEF